MRLKCFLIFLLLAALLPRGGVPDVAVDPAPARNAGVLLVIPSRPRVLQIFFDLAQARDLTMVSFRSNAPASAPILHVWTGQTWRPLDFDDFCALRFVKPAPETVIIAGDDQAVPPVLWQGLKTSGRIVRLPSLEVSDLAEGLDRYFHFSGHEWNMLADRYGLQRKETKTLPPAPAPAARTKAQQQVVSAARAPEAGPVAGKAAGKTAGKFLLDIGEGLQIAFIWIEPLALWVGESEITNAQYERFDRAHDPKKYYDHVINKPDQPAVLVSWEDAHNYCGWLNRNYAARLPDGCACRLPTEQEWMAFAACGREKTYPWGGRWPPPAGYNYKGMEGSSLFYNMVHNERFIRNHEDGFIVTAPVSQSGTNAWGLYGVGGNVWEWCQDWFDDTKITRVLKGAAWNNYEPRILAISNRSDASPEKSNAMIGFRVVIAPRPAPAGPRGSVTP